MYLFSILVACLMFITQDSVVIDNSVQPLDPADQVITGPLWDRLFDGRIVDALKDLIVDAVGTIDFLLGCIQWIGVGAVAAVWVYVLGVGVGYAVKAFREATG